MTERALSRFKGSVFMTGLCAALFSVVLTPSSSWGAFYFGTMTGYVTQAQDWGGQPLPSEYWTSWTGTYSYSSESIDGSFTPRENNLSIRCLFGTERNDSQYAEGTGSEGYYPVLTVADNGQEIGLLFNGPHGNSDWGSFGTTWFYYVMGIDVSGYLVFSRPEIAPVPEPSTFAAGLLLIAPLAVQIFRVPRRKAA